MLCHNRLIGCWIWLFHIIRSESIFLSHLMNNRLTFDTCFESRLKHDVAWFDVLVHTIVSAVKSEQTIRTHQRLFHNLSCVLFIDRWLWLSVVPKHHVISRVSKLVEPVNLQWLRNCMHRMLFSWINAVSQWGAMTSVMTCLSVLILVWVLWVIVHFFLSTMWRVKFTLIFWFFQCLLLSR